MESCPIRSVIIIRAITKSNDREAGVPFVNQEYDYRPTSDDTNHNDYDFRQAQHIQILLME